MGKECSNPNIKILEPEEETCYPVLNDLMVGQMFQFANGHTPAIILNKLHDKAVLFLYLHKAVEEQTYVTPFEGRTCGSYANYTDAMYKKVIVLDLEKATFRQRKHKQDSICL